MTKMYVTHIEKWYVAIIETFVPILIHWFRIIELSWKTNFIFIIIPFALLKAQNIMKMLP